MAGHAREGVVEGDAGAGRLLVLLADAETVPAVPGRRLRERGAAVAAGDAVLLLRPDGTHRRFEFRSPPERAGEIPLPDRPAALTRGETVAMMREAGFADVDLRSSPDLAPAEADVRVVVFLGRKPER